jgi:hypothetical protein
VLFPVFLKFLKGQNLDSKWNVKIVEHVAIILH